ncbi:leucyl-tRNA synthetase [Hibiscus syriacus]|uniref:Leucyl-tRNA synthetase n=1 Tax=Hibiscus syriacus TaxID=106335 RepID=A0A6A2Z8H2_HIBSY|nr:leucyl-tRNA synthetase [Hibiscus syriacus]
MPLTIIFAEAFGVLTICLVALLILLGLVCIGYTFYLRSHVLRLEFNQFSIFSGPWIIRITFVLFTIWWGFGEILRLNFLRRQGKVFNALDFKWQENVCKCYIVSNLGFAEPCLFLTLVLLLRAPLQNIDTGILSQKWNGKIAGCVLLFCLPLFILQLFLILIGSELREVRRELPPYFTRVAAPGMQNSDDIALCTYPLLNTILLGLFATALTAYLLWLGRRILKLVINKALGNLNDLEARRRVVFDDNDTASLFANLGHPEGSVAMSLERSSDASTKRGSISFRTFVREETSSGPFVELSLFSPSRGGSPPGSPARVGWPMRSPTRHVHGQGN